MSGWADLAREVSVWEAEARRLPLWWRDDDAVAPTPQLDRLRATAQAASMSVHLAVIPAHATPELARYLSENASPFRPLVHGWAHVNHAPATQKKSEFGTPRSDALSEAGQALARLQTLLGSRLLPVFVPPWNRIHPCLLAALPGLGYKAVSGFTPRAARQPVPGLGQVNTHLDPVDWRGTQGLRDTQDLLAQTCALLEDRRLGRSDAREPFGLLTHHLIHDEDVWAFCARLIDTLAPIAAPAGPLQDSEKVTK